jgi:hypothetical protein
MGHAFFVALLPAIPRFRDLWIDGDQSSGWHRLDVKIDSSRPGSDPDIVLVRFTRKVHASASPSD